MKTFFNQREDDDQALYAGSEQGSIYDTLLYTVLQKPRERASGGIVIALSSSNPGEGVTYVARTLIQELAKCKLTSVAGVNVSFLRKLHEPTIEAIRKTIARRGASDDERENSGNALMAPHGRGPWEGSWQYRRDCISLLRSEFDYTIIDCPSLKESGDLLGIAPFVDGVVLVVEANRTHREQPHQAEQCIYAAGGTVLGYILNKRTFEMPRWLCQDN